MPNNAALPEKIARRLSKTGLAVFLFHGVIPHQTHRVRNYTGKHIEANVFRLCMARLAKVGQALSMDQVLRHCETGSAFPPYAYAITFDDGFENNLSVAAPILAEFNIPATIYITTRFIEENAMSWIDRIEYAVERAQNRTLKEEWSDEDFTLDDIDSRIYFLQAVRNYVKQCSDCNADTFADALCARLGINEQPVSNDPLDRKMTWEQVRTAANNPLLTIGGHSHTHAILSYLAPIQLADELDISLHLLQQQANITPIHYSYPEGLPHCYSDQVIQALKQRGIRCCPTAIDGINTAATDPFRLKRIMVA